MTEPSDEVWWDGLQAVHCDVGGVFEIENITDEFAQVYGESMTWSGSREQFDREFTLVDCKGRTVESLAPPSVNAIGKA